MHLKLRKHSDAKEWEDLCRTIHVINTYNNETKIKSFTRKLFLFCTLKANFFILNNPRFSYTIGKKSYGICIKFTLNIRSKSK